MLVLAGNGCTAIWLVSEQSDVYASRAYLSADRAASTAGECPHLDLICAELCQQSEDVVGLVRYDDVVPHDERRIMLKKKLRAILDKSDGGIIPFDMQQPPHE